MLAEASGARLTLLHARPAGRPLAPATRARLETLARDAERIVEDVRLDLIEGPAPEAPAAWMRGSGVDLAVLGAGAEAGGADGVAAGLAAAAPAAAPAALLVPRRAGPRSVGAIRHRRVLAVLDATAGDAVALPAALALAEAHGARVLPAAAPGAPPPPASALPHGGPPPLPAAPDPLSLARAARREAADLAVAARPDAPPGPLPETARALLAEARLPVLLLPGRGPRSGLVAAS